MAIPFDSRGWLQPGQRTVPTQRLRQDGRLVAVCLVDWLVKLYVYARHSEERSRGNGANG